MTNEHGSLEKYTSHTLFERVVKWLCVRGELETEQTATYWPPVPLSLAALFFSFCWAAKKGGPEGPALGWELVLTASNCNSNFNCLTPTNWTLCGTGLYNCLTSTCFLWASHLCWIQPVHGQSYILISSTGCTSFSIDGWVEGQYVTHLLASTEGRPEITNNYCSKDFLTYIQIMV